MNWVNISFDSPDSNITGGGSGIPYETLGNCSATSFSQASWSFCEHSLGYWTYWQDFEISEFQPSGTYRWSISVENAASLQSRALETTINVQNSTTVSKPTITSAQITSDAGLTSGSGGDVKFELVVNSEAPVNWLNSSLEGPSSNVFGGGSGVTYSECSSYTTGKPALCGSYGEDYWYYTINYSYSQYEENGSYSFSGISAQNEAGLTSDSYSGSLQFSISGNTPATTPSITSGAVYSVANYGDDPITTGTDITGTCLVAVSQPDPLVVAVVLNVGNSNVPVDWLNRSFEGPTANLEGGGSAPSSATDLGGDSWRVVHYNSIASPNFAQKGAYYYHNLTVENAGNKTSNSYGGVSLGFELKASCLLYAIVRIGK